MRNRILLIRLVFALFVAVLSAGTLSSAGAEPLKIRQGWGVITTVAPMIFSDPTMLPHYGKSYVIEPTHFAGSSPELTALATGQIDMITIAYSTLPIAVENAHLEDLRIVADGFQDGVKGYLSQPYLVRNDGTIKTVADMKGKVFGINVIGGALDIAGRAMLKRSGLTAEKDYTVVEGPLPALGAMLLEKKVDLIPSAPPFLYDPKLQAGAHTLFTMKDAMGPSQLIMLAARASFLEKNRAALDDFFEDLVRGTRWLDNPANHEKAVAIAARFGKISPKQIDSYFLTKKDMYRDPDCMPNIAALQRNIDTQRELGFIKTDFNVRKYVDLTFVQRAVARISHK